MSNVVLGDIVLDDHLALLGERQSPKQAVNVVHGYNGGATIQKAPGITAGSLLQLEATQDDNALWGSFTWLQIEQLRAIEELGQPVTLLFYSRSYQVIIVTDWSTFEPVGIRLEPKADNHDYLGIITMYRTTG